MTSTNVDPPKRWLRLQLTALYAGLFAVLVTAVLAVTGLLQRQGATSSTGVTSSHNAIFGQHFDVGPLVAAVIVVGIAVGVAWWIAGQALRRSTPSAPK